MAFPEDTNRPAAATRSPERADRPRCVPCMSLSRGQAIPQALQRYLHEARNSRCRDGLAAPEIRRTEKALGDAHEIGFERRRSGGDAAPNEAAMRLTANAPLILAISIRAPIGSAIDRWQLDIRGRENRTCAARATVVGRHAATGPTARWPATTRHSRPTSELAPGPAFVAGLVDRDALAFQRLGIERRFVERVPPHRRYRVDHFATTCPRQTARPRPGPSRCLAARSAAGGLGTVGFQGDREAFPTLYKNARVSAGIENHADSAVALAQQRIERARGLALAAFRAAGLGRRRPGVDVEMHPRLWRRSRTASGTARR